MRSLRAVLVSLFLAASLSARADTVYTYEGECVKDAIKRWARASRVAVSEERVRRMLPCVLRSSGIASDMACGLPAETAVVISSECRTLRSAVRQRASSGKSRVIVVSRPRAPDPVVIHDNIDEEIADIQEGIKKTVEEATSRAVDSAVSQLKAELQARQQLPPPAPQAKAVEPAGSSLREFWKRKWTDQVTSLMILLVGLGLGIAVILIIQKRRSAP